MEYFGRCSNGRPNLFISTICKAKNSRLSVGFFYFYAPYQIFTENYCILVLVKSYIKSMKIPLTCWHMLGARTFNSTVLLYCFLHIVRAGLHWYNPSVLHNW